MAPLSRINNMSLQDRVLEWPEKGLPQTIAFTAEKTFPSLQNYLSQTIKAKCPWCRKEMKLVRHAGIRVSPDPITGTMPGRIFGLYQAPDIRLFEHSLQKCHPGTFTFMVESVWSFPDHRKSFLEHCPGLTGAVEMIALVESK